MAPSMCNHGVGAIVLALIHFIHPSEHIRQKFPNPIAGQRPCDCQTIQQEMKKVMQKDQLILVVHHKDFMTDAGDFIDLYAVKHYWKVQKAGNAFGRLIFAKAKIDHGNFVSRNTTTRAKQLGCYYD